MNMSVFSTQASENAVDFSLAITWSEPDGQRLLNVMLLSPTQSLSLCSEPHRKCANISLREFSRLIKVLESNQIALMPGKYVSDEPEYFIEITHGGQLQNCGIGLGQRTVGLLNQMANAIDSMNREPISALIRQIESFLRGKPE